MINARITEETKAWLINLACKKPTDNRYASGMWIRSALADHGRRYGPGVGHDSLKKAVKATVQRILFEHPLPPRRRRKWADIGNAKVKTKSLKFNK